MLYAIVFFPLFPFVHIRQLMGAVMFVYVELLKTLPLRQQNLMVCPTEANGTKSVTAESSPTTSFGTSRNAVDQSHWLCHGNNSPPRDLVELQTLKIH